jgi:5-methylcytosine-specific restriction endonuclease McrA
MPTKPATACIACDAGHCDRHGTGITATTAVVPTAPKEQQASDHEKYRYLYDRSRWRHPTKGLRAACLRRHPICKDPFKIGCHQPSTVADHIQDHHGNEQLFFNFSNLQGFCESCHDRKTASSHGKAGRQLEPKLPFIDGDGKVCNQS